MIIDCDCCEVRGNACDDCVIGVILGPPAPREEATEVDLPPGAPVVQLDAPERRALDVLADQGLVPRLRLVVAGARRVTFSADTDQDGYHAG